MSRVDQLVALQQVCLHCSMCGLGLGNTDCISDPHVPGWLDTMSTLPRYMVVGQNPGKTEVIEKIPFVGSAGKTFDEALDKYGGLYSISRKMFYITNVVKCLTYGNKPPNQEAIDRCMPFLQIEVATINPKFIIILGSVAFSVLCPDLVFSDSLGKPVSTRFGVKAIPTYHPSPLNLQDENRLARFNKDMEMICRIIGRLESPF